MSQRANSTYVKSLQYVSPKIRQKELKKLTLSKVGNSQMMYKLHSFNGDEVAVILKKDGKYVGWSLTYGLKSGKPKAMFYIDENYRTKGLGKHLFKRTEKMLRQRRYKVIYVAPWNKASRAFFAGMGCGLDMDNTSNSELFHWKKLL